MIAAVTLFAAAAAAAAAQCVDEHGTNVDWWFLYKYPLSASSRDDGTKYAWMSSATSSLVESSSDVTSEASILGAQLKGVYEKATGLSYVLYNDQWPNGSWTEDFGHSKGAIAFEGDGSGFFLHHSIPDFPNYVAEGYKYGRGQEKYGQSASCFSLRSLADVDAWGYAARFANPWIFDHSVASAPGNVTELLKGHTWYDAKASMSLDASGGLKFFAKTRGFHADLVDDVLAPGLGEDLVSQSWLNSGTPLGADCSAAHTVVDTKTLQYGASTSQWPTQQDHAKWSAAAAGAAAPWVCANDNNRDESQFKRGGLAVCLQDAKWHAALLSGVKATAECGPSPAPGPGPAPPPGPAPSGKCCHYSDGHCTPGDVCCKSHCDDVSSCSYTEEGCSGKYGAIHHCAWDGGFCKVSK